MRTTLALAGALAGAYVLLLLRLVLWHPAFVAGAVALAGVLALRAWRRRPAAAGAPARAAVALLVGLYLLPFARLAFWNAQSPLFQAAGAWQRWLSRAVAGGYHPHEALPAPLFALYLLAALLPTLLVGAALALAPLLAGGLAARAAARARAALPAPAALGLLAACVAAGVVLFPVACDVHESFEDAPSRTCACAGVEVAWYPPGISDAARVDYCVGLERAVERP